MGTRGFETWVVMVWSWLEKGEGASQEKVVQREMLALGYAEPGA